MFMALSVVSRGAAFVAGPGTRVGSAAVALATGTRRAASSQRIAAAAVAGASHGAGRVPGRVPGRATGRAAWCRPAAGQPHPHAHGHAQSLVRLWSSAGTTPGSTASAEGGAGGEGGEKDEEEVARLKAERERRKEEKAAAKVIS